MNYYNCGCDVFWCIIMLFCLLFGFFILECEIIEWNIVKIDYDGGKKYWLNLVCCKVREEFNIGKDFYLESLLLVVWKFL